MTLAEFKKEVLEWSKAAHRHPTWRANRLALNKLEALVGPDMDLGLLGPRHADRMVTLERQAGKRVNSANNYLRHLKACFTKAVEWGLLPASPFEKVRQLRKDRVRPVFLTESQINEFLATITDVDLRLLIVAYLATGRRRSELAELRWDQVDLTRGMYRIEKSKQHWSREYPINGMFRKVLEAAPRNGSPFVFRWRHPDSVTKVVKRALRLAGLDHLHAHHLRHSFASLYLAKGGDIRVLMDLLGHSQISTTMVYSHLTPSRLSEESERVQFCWPADS